jgi:predicted 2-oxoglutarate/Fe(II)-dependent dioxygenase YbiX
MINYQPYQNYFDVLGKNKDNIVIINNFINDEDLLAINNYLDLYKDNDEFIGGKDLRQEKVKEENPAVAEILDKYEKKISEKVYELFTEKYQIPVIRKPVNPTHFVKWVPGMNSKLHCDCEKPDGTPALAADFYTYNVSVLMYPNDEYVGGEITFPDYDLTLKPKPGDMILFPGNNSYKHTVQTVESGRRYTMPSWYSFDVNEPVSKQNKEYSYKDSVQLWEGLPDFDKIDPLGIETRENYNERL